MGLPCTEGNMIRFLVSVDRLTKSTHFILVKATYSAEEYAKLYLEEMVRMHGDFCLSFLIGFPNLLLIFGKHSKLG